jgi:hypothetical protein
MARGPKPVPITLSKEERAALEGLVRRRRTGQDVAMRARIVLACADPQASNTGISARLAVSRSCSTMPPATRLGSSTTGS